MHARDVDARRKQVRIPRQTLRRENAPVREPPEPDPGRIHVAAVAQVLAGRLDVAVFGVPASAPPRRVAELAAVPDPAPVVHRQHHVALVREVLIHRVGHVVEVHVVVAEQHLPPRPAVDEDHRRPLLAGLQVRWQEQLVVELVAVLGLEGDRLGHDVLVQGVARRQLPDRPRLTAVRRHHGHGQRLSGICVQHRHLVPRCQRRRVGLDAVAVRELPRLAPCRGHAPQVAAVDVPRVGGVEESAAIRRQRDILRDAVSRGKFGG